MCDSDTDIGCVGDCDGCEPVNDPATNYVDCVLASTEDDLDDTEDLIDDDFDETDEESDETGLFGVVEGTYADYEEIYIIDPDTPYTNEIEITPSWCD
ncbi:MAG: hypothetical protein JSS30_01865 [Verrucomicrobia bacterium]|nr:hypothetical protein [Verrucomicrobiota bacterium]